MTNQLTPRGLQLLKHHEGFVPYAYDDFDPSWPRKRIMPGDKVRGTLTIGYGTTRGVKPGDTCTEKQAEGWLLEDLRQAERCVQRHVKVPISDEQYSALASFVYNLGCWNFYRSTLRRKLNAGDYAGAAAEFPKWRKSRGVVMAGLESRRKDERALFEANGVFA